LINNVSFACSNYDIFSDIQGGKLLSSDSYKFDFQNKDSIFFGSNDKIALETPDLKVIEDNTISSIAVPSVVSLKVLGDTFGASYSDKREVADYVVQPGDTADSIAKAHNISVNTLLWANELTSSSQLKNGQSVVILPVDGVLHTIKSGDLLDNIAKKYNAKVDDIIAFNNLANENDIYVGDILVVPGGTLRVSTPKGKSPTQSPLQINVQIPLANNYFIFPVQGKITQGLHYFNAVDIANQCGTPIYAAASGTVQRAVFNNKWNLGMGNYITILHPNGTVTYYGHLSSVFVKSGESVQVGQNIGLVGKSGKVIGVTGCHLHFQVMGAANPLAKYSVGSTISYK